MLKEEKIFYFLEGIGTLLWVFMDVFWLFGVGIFAMFFAILAVLANLLALAYASLKLSSDIVPLKAVVGYNLWVVMGALWAVGEFSGLGKLVFLARMAGFTLIMVAIWEFSVNRNNTEQSVAFMRNFRKFRIR